MGSNQTPKPNTLCSLSTKQAALEVEICLTKRVVTGCCWLILVLHVFVGN
ncbi:hypothetical protein Fmac_006944 [Flemingia macrophylla]|uniref:Uncharacterized protein n=1 Tax=Flemingia macrophylla TaxID=520843 RepID=A0ABD1NC28_9FABA